MDSIEKMFIEGLKDYATFCHAQGHDDLATSCEAPYADMPLSVMTVAKGLLTAMGAVPKIDQEKFIRTGVTESKDDLSTRSALVGHLALVVGNGYLDVRREAQTFPDAVLRLMIPMLGYAEGLLAAITGETGVPARLLPHWSGPVRLGYVQAQLIARGAGSYGEIMCLWLRNDTE
jgi:hypothetical protein